MGLFYAYLKNKKNDITWRYLITFVDREAADEWWRMISKSPSPYASHVKRISPQFYIQDDVGHNNVALAFEKGWAGAPPFLEKMFFTLLHDRDGRVQSTIPSIDVTDHISGRWYFIRSKDDPRRHWYFRIDGACLVCREEDCDAIHVSTEHRTRFSVEARNQDNGYNASKDFVMIGGDPVLIAASKDYTVRINDMEDLKATKGNTKTDLLFGDLMNRFVTRAERRDNGEIWEYVVPVERGHGENWQLFN